MKIFNQVRWADLSEFRSHFGKNISRWCLPFRSFKAVTALTIMTEVGGWAGLVLGALAAAFFGALGAFAAAVSVILNFRVSDTSGWLESLNCSDDFTNVISLIYSVEMTGWKQSRSRVSLWILDFVNSEKWHFLELFRNFSNFSKRFLWGGFDSTKREYDFSDKIEKLHVWTNCQKPQKFRPDSSILVWPKSMLTEESATHRKYLRPGENMNNFVLFG